MKDFEEYLQDHENAQEAEKARIVLQKLISLYRKEGFYLFIETLAGMNMVRNQTVFYTAWAAFRILDIELVPAIFDSPVILQNYCRAQAGRVY